MDLNPLEVPLIFASLLGLCLLASEAFRPLRSTLFPRDLRESRNLAAHAAYHLPLCIGILAVILAVIPAAYGLATLVGVLALAVLLTEAYRRLRTGTASLGWLPELRETWRVWRAHPFPLLLTAVSFLYFGVCVAYMAWPPPGDIMNLHGPVTTYLSVDGYRGVAERVWYFYPFGFHLLPAALVAPFGLYPGEAVFAFGGFVAVLVPLMIFLVTKRLGAPTLLALLAFTAAFVVQPGGNLEEWILGSFFNGTYPEMLGDLIVLLVVLLQVDRLPVWGSPRMISYAEATLLYSAILFFIYPTFAALLVLHLFVFSILRWTKAPDRPRSETERARHRRHLLIIVVLVIAAVATAAVLLRSYILLAWHLYSAPPTSDALNYRLDLWYFVTNPGGFLVLVSTAIAVQHLRKGRHVGLSSFYVMIAALLAVSLVPPLYLLIWPVLPSRSVILLSMLAWPLFLPQVLPAYVRVRPWLARRKAGSAWGRLTRLGRWVHGRRITRRALDTRLVSWSAPRARKALTPVATVFLVVLAVQVATNVTINPVTSPNYYGWFTETPYFVTDFGGIRWLAAHAGPHALVLTDGSYASRFAVSLAPLNLTNDLPIENFDLPMYYALNRIWAEPLNKTYMMTVLKQYNVTYIFSSADRDTLDRVGSHRYVLRPWFPAFYTGVFDTYSFLQVRYAAGDTRVYWVDQAAL